MHNEGSQEETMRKIGEVGIDALTMEQYLALPEGGQSLEIGMIEFMNTWRRIPAGTINTWDLLEKAFIQRYSSPPKVTKQLEEIHNFKQEGGLLLARTPNQEFNAKGSPNGV
ncbi:hypothetical protein Tco_0103076 [Tanacetum coccineum]